MIFVVGFLCFLFGACVGIPIGYYRICYWLRDHPESSYWKIINAKKKVAKGL